MSQIENFGETQNVKVVVLVDNRSSAYGKTPDSVVRFSKKSLLAEHGLANLIDLKDIGLRILWDAGLTRITLMENLKRMEIDPASIDIIAVSHGHRDHTAMISDLLREIGGRSGPREWDKDSTPSDIQEWLKSQKIPIIIHPAAFRERWGIRHDGTKYGPFIIPYKEWEAVGAELIPSEEPYKLGPGCWTTGTIPRKSFEKSGINPYMAYRNGEKFFRDDLVDDQAIVINIKDKGLIVISGCAHSGIVNTVNHAKEISGINKIWAIIGGFHLGSASDQEIQQTIDAIKQMKPKMIVPSHCTSFKAMAQFSNLMPDEFVLNAVGTKFSF